VIYLGNAEFAASRTIDPSLKFVGTNNTSDTGRGGTRITGNWTIANEFDGCTLKNVAFETNATVNSRKSKFINCSIIGRTTITVNEDNVIFNAAEGSGTVEFASGTSNGVVDSSSGLTVTDNDGGNTVGDIA